MDINSVLDGVTKGGVIGLLLFGVLGFLRGIIIPRWMYDSIVRDRDEWKTAYKELLTITQKTVGRR